MITEQEIRDASARRLLNEIGTWDREFLEMFAVYMARLAPTSYVVAVNDITDMRQKLDQSRRAPNLTD